MGLSARAAQEYAEIALLLAAMAAACVVLVWAVALLSQKAARIVGYILFCAYVGLLPITAVIALMFALYFLGNTTSDGLAAVPWPFFYTVPMCAITIPVAIVAAIFVGRREPNG